MNKANPPFSQEYSVGFETSVEVKNQVEPHTVVPSQLIPNLEDASKAQGTGIPNYGSDKPKRIIMRAQLTQ